ncbi:hypothetical protein NUM3379_16010 [Kineococcus sp. NUM-3379]
MGAHGEAHHEGGAEEELQRGQEAGVRRVGAAPDGQAQHAGDEDQDADGHADPGNVPRQLPHRLAHAVSSALRPALRDRPRHRAPRVGQDDVNPFTTARSPVSGNVAEAITLPGHHVTAGDA